MPGANVKTKKDKIATAMEAASIGEASDIIKFYKGVTFQKRKDWNDKYSYSISTNGRYNIYELKKINIKNVSFYN